MRRNKYNAKKTVYASIQGFARTYDSKREAKHANDLDNLILDKDVLFWLPQPKFHLPGGVTYTLDFQVFWADGTISFQDVKGVLTESTANKIKQTEALYPVKVEIVK